MPLAGVDVKNQTGERLVITNEPFIIDNEIVVITANYETKKLQVVNVNDLTVEDDLE